MCYLCFFTETAIFEAMLLRLCIVSELALLAKHINTYKEFDSAFCFLWLYSRHEAGKELQKTSKAQQRQVKSILCI